MTTASVSQDLPRLRRLPVPVTQPRPALRVVRDDPDDVPASQGMLALTLLADEARDDRGAVDVTAAEPSRAGRTDLVPDGGQARSGGGMATSGTGVGSASPVRLGDPVVTGVGTVPGRPATRNPAATRGPRTVDLRSVATASDEFSAQRRTPGHALPEPGRWAAQFVQAAVEVTTGLRPSSQLIRWTSDEVQTMLTRRAGLARAAAARGRRPRRSVVRSTRVCIPRDGVAEASAVVTDGSRFRAVALRLEGLDGRWRVTALQIG
jgi:hypothetical protein